MLESLRQGAGTLNELNLDGAFPERAPYRPRELYAELKQTPLFDAEDEQWNGSVSEEQELAHEFRYADTQLLGVLVEAQFNPKAAQERYEKLKATPLYDAERGQWQRGWAMNEEPLMERPAMTQLLGVLAEAKFDPENARRLYERLKATPLYDRERRQWNDRMSEEQDLEGTERCAEGQLVGVLVEAQFNLTEAQGLYEKLKTTPLYDAECGQWNQRIIQELDLELEFQRETSERYADAQLLGVLVEAQFNPEGARKLYERLKATPLYDSTREQWNWSMNAEQELNDSDRFADAQLLGVLVEAKLLSTVSAPLVKAIPPLPTTKDW